MRRDDPTITVRKIDEMVYEVTVDGPPMTTHEVHIDDAYHEQLTDGEITPEELIEKSFEFLLEREPNTSILSQFDLPAINSYFPEYEEEIQHRLP